MKSGKTFPTNDAPFCRARHRIETSHRRAGLNVASHALAGPTSRDLTGWAALLRSPAPRERDRPDLADHARLAHRDDREDVSGQTADARRVGSDRRPYGAATPEACWKCGLVYWNSADPALFVETRFGVGYMRNFAHRGASCALAGLLAFPLVIAFFGLLVSAGC